MAHPQPLAEREIVSMRAEAGGVGELHIRLANVGHSPIDSEAMLTVALYAVGGPDGVRAIHTSPVDPTTGRHYPPPGKRQHRLTLAVGEVRTLVLTPAKLVWSEQPGVMASDELRDTVLSSECDLHALLSFESGGPKHAVIGPIRLRMVAR